MAGVNDERAGSQLVADISAGTSTSKIHDAVTLRRAPTSDIGIRGGAGGSGFGDDRGRLCTRGFCGRSRHIRTIPLSATLRFEPFHHAREGDSLANVVDA